MDLRYNVLPLRSDHSYGRAWDDTRNPPILFATSSQTMAKYFEEILEADVLKGMCVGTILPEGNLGKLIESLPATLAGHHPHCVVYAFDENSGDTDEMLRDTIIRRLSLLKSDPSRIKFRLVLITTTKEMLIDPRLEAIARETFVTLLTKHNSVQEIDDAELPYRGLRAAGSMTAEAIASAIFVAAQ